MSKTTPCFIYLLDVILKCGCETYCQMPVGEGPCYCYLRHGAKSLIIRLLVQDFLLQHATHIIDIHTETEPLALGGSQAAIPIQKRSAWRRPIGKHGRHDLLHEFV